MDLGIRGRKALLSGASRGMGKACAMALAEDGVDLFIVARTRDVLENTCAEIRAATGVTVTPVVGERRRDAPMRWRPVPRPTSCSTMPTARSPAISGAGLVMIGSPRSTR